MKGFLITLFASLAIATPLDVDLTIGDTGSLHSRTNANACPAAHCSLKGWERSTKVGLAYWWTRDSHYQDQATCGKLCNLAQKCKAFSIGEGVCRLYENPVSDCAKSDSRGPRLFSNKCCVKPVPPPTPAPPTCGLKGWDKERPRAFYLDTSGKKANVAACKALCSSKNGCVSFAFDSKTCLLYNAPLAKNFNANSASPYKFYEMKCPGLPNLPTSTSTPWKTSTTVKTFSTTKTSSTVQISSTIKSSSSSPTPSPSSSTPTFTPSSSTPTPTPSSSIPTPIPSSSTPAPTSSSISSSTPTPTHSSSTPSATPSSSSTPVSSPSSTIVSTPSSSSIEVTTSSSETPTSTSEPTTTSSDLVSTSSEISSTTSDAVTTTSETLSSTPEPTPTSSDIASTSSDVPITTTPEPAPTSIDMPSSTSDISSDTPTPTPTVNPIRGANIVNDPSFEDVTGTGPSATFNQWSTGGEGTGRRTYPNRYQPAAHSGSTYAILNVFASLSSATVFQTIHNFDVAAPYTLTFYYDLHSFSGFTSCTLTASLGGVNIYSRVLTSADDPRPFNWKGPETTSAINPSAADQDLLFGYSCDGAASGSSYIFLEDLYLSTPAQP